MFSGIIESTQKVLEVTPLDQALRIKLSRPSSFDDLKVGDSIAVNGVCLTLEEFDTNFMFFTLGFESLRILKWTEESISNKQLNLERSLKFGDRIHGHLVSGHVDSLAQVLEKTFLGESLFFRISLPVAVRAFVWTKGSIAVQGVSLTVNEITKEDFTICLIPETLKKTNLEKMQIGDWVNIEADYLIKGLSQSKNLEGINL